jgi:hypothetical protein
MSGKHPDMPIPPFYAGSFVSGGKYMVHSKRGLVWMKEETKIYWHSLRQSSERKKKSVVLLNSRHH